MPRRQPTPFRVAILGKGGSGKSVVAGTLARLLARAGHRVLALDSDPMPGMALSMGVPAGNEAMLDGFAERDPTGEWRIVRGLAPATVVRRAALRGPDGVLFLQFGKADTASTAPLMSSLQAFWVVTQQLPPRPWTVVHDLPAGTRQAFSGWAGSADWLLIVVEPTQKSILSARRLAGVREVTGGSVRLIANKVRSMADRDVVADGLPGLELVAALPFDPAVSLAEREGVAPIDRDPQSPAVAALKALASKLESMAGKESA
ncbi:N/A [soil metagenome]